MLLELDKDVLCRAEGLDQVSVGFSKVTSPKVLQAKEASPTWDKHGE